MAFPSIMAMSRSLRTASKFLVWSKKSMEEKGLMKCLFILRHCLTTCIIIFVSVTPLFCTWHTIYTDYNEPDYLPWIMSAVQTIHTIVLIITLHFKDEKYESLMSKLDSAVKKFGCDENKNKNRFYIVCIGLWSLAICCVSVVFIVIVVMDKISGLKDILYIIWWCTCTGLAHFQLICVSVMLRNISKMIRKLKRTVEELLKKINKVELTEENAGEMICQTLKTTEDSYDAFCDCCFEVNEVFGFSVFTVMSGMFVQNLLSVYMTSRYVNYSKITFVYANFLQFYLSFHALVVMAASGEAVPRAARALARALARLNVNLCREVKSAHVCMAARDALRAVRARRPRVGACGLFDLRMTLVTGFLSLTATYSIVLLQFTHFL